MLYRAQIMLLDEPTNHLDVKNVAWLVNYLTGLTEVTSVIVSHDSTFLDNVCQSIVHYENRKLRIYKVRSTPLPCGVTFIPKHCCLLSAERMGTGRIALLLLLDMHQKRERSVWAEWL